MKQILVVWKKELRDTIRDHRTLLAMIIMPMILMPLITVGFIELSVYQAKKAEQKIVKISISGGNYARDFINVIKKQPKVEIIKTDSRLDEAIRDGEVDAGIIIPQDFQAAIERQEPIKVTVLGKSTSENYSTVLARLNTAVADFNNEVLQERFASKGLSQDILSQVLIEEKDVTTERERGGFVLGLILSVFIVMWAIIGGQYTAIDVSAGEKERKTLEALLLTPAKRFNIVMGKFFAVATTALVSIIVSLASMYVAFKYSAPGFINVINSSQPQSNPSSVHMTFDFSINLNSLALAFVVSVFLVLMFSGVLLSIAIFAKSFKEAQNYIAPAYLIALLPVFILGLMPSFKPAIWVFALPIVNAPLILREVLSGLYDISHILVTIFSLIIYSIVATSLATWLYNKEGVLFKT